MLKSALELIAGLAYCILIPLWIRGLIFSDGKKGCAHDCENCPFPPCDKPEDNR